MYRITREKQNYKYEMKREHYHEFYELYYLISGTRRMFIDNQVYYMHDGDLILIPKGMIHRTSYLIEGKSTPPECERIALGFDDECIKTLLQEIGNEKFLDMFQQKRIQVPINRRADIIELMDKILEESKQIDEYSDYLAKKHCEELLLFIFRCQNLESEQIAQDSIMDQDMIDAVSYMNEHFMEEITLHHMALRASMSDSYFSKRFRLITGFGYKEYLNTVRIRHACRLLLTTELSITEISSACGYMDSNYFGDAFKKIKNISPREYRKAKIV